MTLDWTIGLFQDAMAQGGLVMWPILLVCVVIWYAGFGRLWSIVAVRVSRKRFLNQLGTLADRDSEGRARTGQAAFNDFLAVAPEIRSGQRDLGYSYRELLMTLVPHLDRGFSTMTAWIAVAPLLGLLGTVVGMVETFEVINLFGIGNPHLMAQGISKALLTTQAGLTVAFPALIFQLVLANQKKRLVQLLQGDQDVIARRLGLQPAEGEA